MKVRVLIFLWACLVALAGCGKPHLINASKLEVRVPAQVVPPSTVIPMPGYAIVAGGGIARGDGMLMTATVGGFGSPVVTTPVPGTNGSATAYLLNGLQGVLYDPEF